jgi:uncharacterized metal-binding protein
VALDGCAEDCARGTLELAGLRPTDHLRVTDRGLEKGKAPATDDNVAAVLALCRSQVTEAAK